MIQPSSNRSVSAAVVFALLAGAGPFGCGNESVSLGGPMQEYRLRMAASAQERPDSSDPQQEAPAATQSSEPRAFPSRGVTTRPGGRAALITAPQIATQPSPEDILAQIPDPSESEQTFASRLSRLESEAREARVVDNYKRAVAQANVYLSQLRREKQLRLSLAECVQRALQNNYAVRIRGIDPAIARNQLVEAEAAFDAVFFLDTSWAEQDTPVDPAVGTDSQSDTRGIAGGVRKLLPTGATVSTSLQHSRNWRNLGKTTLMNPAYSGTFVAEISQPLLRGFGLDYNRAQINISRADQKIAQERFIQQLSTTLLDVERAYWQLARLRREVMILAESVALNMVTYENVEKRLVKDATIVELSNALSRWKTREVQYQAAVSAVEDAEDVLKNLLNDPELTLAESVELIPIDNYFAAPMALDQLAEVRTALDSRSAIREARLRIEQSRVQSQVAKSDILPQLDLSFVYEVNGLGDTFDESFDRITASRYQDYTVRVQFSQPIGERAARARYRSARLRESQAILTLKQITDAVVQEVNNAVRRLNVNYKNIPTQLGAVQAAARNLAAFQARIEAISPPVLDSELAATENLANARSTLLQLLTDYNVAIVELENAKGTIIAYNNIVIADGPPQSAR